MKRFKDHDPVFTVCRTAFGVAQNVARCVGYALIVLAIALVSPLVLAVFLARLAWVSMNAKDKAWLCGVPTKVARAAQAVWAWGDDVGYRVCAWVVEVAYATAYDLWQIRGGSRHARRRCDHRVRNCTLSDVAGAVVSIPMRRAV